MADVFPAIKSLFLAVFMCFGGILGGFGVFLDILGCFGEFYVFLVVFGVLFVILGYFVCFWGGFAPMPAFLADFWMFLAVFAHI